MTNILQHDTMTSIWQVRSLLSPNRIILNMKMIQLFFQAIKKYEAFEYLPLILLEINGVHRISLQWLEYVLKNWHKMNEDTKTQIKNIALMQTLHPEFLISRKDYTPSIESKIFSSCLEIIIRSNDKRAIRDTLLMFANKKTSIKLSPKSLQICEDLSLKSTAIIQMLGKLRSSIKTSKDV